MTYQEELELKRRLEVAEWGLESTRRLLANSIEGSEGLVTPDTQTRYVPVGCVELAVQHLDEITERVKN